MTPKEIIDYIAQNWFDGDVSTDSIVDGDVETKVMKSVIEALEKAEKYRWHDLRKDPTDLPTKRDWVLAVFKEPDCDFVLIPRVADYVGHETSATTEEFWLIVDVCTEDMSDYYKSLKCIAWKEEPFEEV